MTLREYLAQRLTADGFDGLACAHHDCGCAIDDLGDCSGTDLAACQPDYRHDCEWCPRHAIGNCPFGYEDAGHCVTTSKDWPEPEAD